MSPIAVVWSAYACLASSGGFSLLQPAPASELPSVRSERPTQADSAFTVAPGHVQLETELWAWRGGLDTSSRAQADFLRTLVRVGIAENVDLQVLLPALSWRGVDGETSVLDATDAYTLRGKWNWLGNDGEGWALALLPWVRIPIDGSGFSAGASLPFGGGVWRGLSFGGMVSVFGNDLGVLPSLRTFVSGYLSWDFGHGFSAFGDLSADVAMANASTQWKTSAGLIWLFHPNVQVDTGVLLDVFTTEPQLAWFTGLSLRG